MVQVLKILHENIVHTLFTNYHLLNHFDLIET